jgi:hypothetical protein
LEEIAFPGTVDHARRNAARGGALIRAFSSEVETGSRQENASNQESRALFRFHRNGKGSRVESRLVILEVGGYATHAICPAQEVVCPMVKKS